MPEVFPTLTGLSWERTRTPIWRTLYQEMVSGKDATVGLMSYPLWEWMLKYERLKSDSTADLQTLMGFFNKCQGRLTPFYYEDLDDKSVTAQLFGTGDGVTTDFQLVRTFGGYVEPIQSLHGTPDIYVSAVKTTALTIGSTGIVSFTSPPADDAPLTWTGSYYWLCRFTMDQADFQQFHYNLWQLKRLTFRYVKQ